MTPSLSSNKNRQHMLGNRGFARLGGLALVVLALLGAGCASQKYKYGLDDHFSMNLMRPPAWLSDPKADLKPAEKEILQRRGRPDFIRVWWNSDGSLIRSSDLAFRFEHLSDLIKATRKSWIYVNSGEKGEEILFVKGGAAYRTQPLSEPIKLLCNYGDPERSTPVTINGSNRETWMWIDRGIKAELIDGKVDSVKEFTRGTGTGTYINR